MYATLSLDTPATRPRPVQSSPSPAWTSSHIIVQIYGTNQVFLDSTRHTMTYEPSTARSRLQMRQRRALELIERGRWHRSNENRPDFTPCEEIGVPRGKKSERYRSTPHYRSRSLKMKSARFEKASEEIGVPREKKSEHYRSTAHRQTDGRTLFRFRASVYPW